jgi:hypothetical protein
LAGIFSGAFMVWLQAGRNKKAREQNVRERQILRVAPRIAESPASPLATKPVRVANASQY